MKKLTMIVLVIGMLAIGPTNGVELSEPGKNATDFESFLSIPLSQSNYTVATLSNTSALPACDTDESLTSFCSDPLSNQSIAELAKAMNLSMRVVNAGGVNGTRRMALGERDQDKKKNAKAEHD